MDDKTGNLVNELGTKMRVALAAALCHDCDADKREREMWEALGGLTVHLDDLIPRPSEHREE